MSEGKHTPLPWTATRFNVRGPDGRQVAEATLAFKSSTETAANAALIVEAVNNYHTLTSQRDKLVKALEDLLAATDGARSGYIDFSEPALRWEARYKQVRHEAETTLSQTKEGA